MVQLRRNSSWSKSFNRSKASTGRTRFSSTRTQESCPTGSSISECRTVTTAKFWSLLCMLWHALSTMLPALRTTSLLRLIAHRRIAFICASTCILRAFLSSSSSAQRPAIDFSSFLLHIAKAQIISTSSQWKHGEKPTRSTSLSFLVKNTLIGTIGSFGLRFRHIKCLKKPMAFSSTGGTPGWGGTSSSLCQCS